MFIQLHWEYPELPCRGRGMILVWHIQSCLAVAGGMREELLFTRDGLSILPCSCRMSLEQVWDAGPCFLALAALYMSRLDCGRAQGRCLAASSRLLLVSASGNVWGTISALLGVSAHLCHKLSYTSGPQSVSKPCSCPFPGVMGCTCKLVDWESCTVKEKLEQECEGAA